eukprot:TRINITY_DN6815_c0_g1_i1.p1 TRINITY_DN6815_c0_g1~~TRINITY_DN6815_c0_g1_i1.p1  ORF type:complete len:261 (-),score=46.43 TRINITY_DN6815_c0_g1_i1:24-806(-)
MDLFAVVKSGDIQKIAGFFRLYPNQDVNVKNNKGQTPIYWATELDNHQIAEYLVRRGAEVNITETNGFTPLHLACHLGRVATVELFLQCGAFTDARTASGLTPLHLASKSNHLQICKLLLSRGHADVTTRDSNGLTPIHYATNIDVSNLLKSVLYRKMQEINELGREMGLTISDDTVRKEETVEIIALKETVSTLTEALKNSSDSSEKKASLCRECGTNPRTMLFVPCMHVCFCKSCADEMAVCGLCNQTITGKIEVKRI